MKTLIFLFNLIFSFNVTGALEYSKIEHPGCPENAYCQKNTGEVRKKWLDLIEDFNKGKISESKLNQEIQKGQGIPVSGWAMEEAGILPRIMMWDSPCPQHKKEASKFYISDFFRKNLRESELKEYNSIYFPKMIGQDSDKKTFSMVIPRGDIPTFVEDGFYHFLREDDGKYYGLLINRQGDIKITKPKIVENLPKEVICLKEQVDLFLRLAPSTTFYQGYSCKNIWDTRAKAYRPMLFGWSCN